MKERIEIFLRTILLVAFLCSVANCSQTTLTGTIKHAQGDGLNGNVVMQLPVPAIVTTTSIVVESITFGVQNGVISGPTPYDVQAFHPMGMYYTARAYDNAGALVNYGNDVVTGTSLDIGAAPPTVITTSNISYPTRTSLSGNNVWTGLNTLNATSDFNGPVNFNAVMFTGQTVFSDESSQQFPVIDVRAYGAVGDAIQQGGCSMTAGSHILRCTDPLGKTFSVADVGKLIGITQAGASDGFVSVLVTTISGFTNGNTVTLPAVAVNTTGAGTIAIYGTDNAAAFCAATWCTNTVYTGIYGTGISTGRELYVPGGAYVTSQPLYCRVNMSCKGAGQGGTQITLLSTVNPLNLSNPISLSSNAYNPVICLGNGAAGSNTCQNDSQRLGAHGSFAVYDIVVSSLGKNPGVLTVSNNGPCCTSGVALRNVWGEGYNRAMFIRTKDVSDTGGISDVGVRYGVVIAGDGLGNTSTTRDYRISDCFAIQNDVGVLLDGVTDASISNCTFDQDFQESILISSAAGYTSTRIATSNNTFEGNPLQSGYQHIEFLSGCVDCSSNYDRFWDAPTYDVEVKEAGGSNAGIVNLRFSHDTFVGGQTLSNSGSVYTDYAGGNYFFEDDLWDTPGSYAVALRGSAVLINNRCINPFLSFGPNSGGTNPYQNGCFYSVASTTARGNLTTSSGGTKYPSIAINGASSDTSDNRSDYSGCAVCLNDNASAASTTLNELVTNYAASGNNLFGPINSNGGFTDLLNGAASTLVCYKADGKTLGHCTSGLSGTPPTCTCGP